MVWLVATIFIIYSFSLNTASGVFSNAIKVALNLDDIQVVFATGSFIFGFAIMQIPGGYLLDRLNARYVVSGGILLLALGNVAISFSHTLFIFVCSNILQGMGASIAFIAAAVLISQWFSKNQFPIIFGFSQTLSCVFSGIIHYYFNIALEFYAWTDIYRFLGLFGFFLLILSIIFIKSPAQQLETKLSLGESLKIVLSNKQIMLSSLAAATSFGVLLAYAEFWYLEVQKFYLVDTQHALIIGGLIFFGIGLGTPFMAWLSDVCKSRKVIIHTGLAMGVMALLLGLYLPQFAALTFIITRVIAFLIGFLLSCSMLFYTIVSETANNHTRGVALSILNTSVFLFNTAMLFIPYWFVTDLSKDFFTYLWVLPFFVVFSILILYFIKESYSSSVSNSDSNSIDNKKFSASTPSSSQE